ncbi:MAG: thioredoxin family protein [Planctomycetota bacterium]
MSAQEQGSDFNELMGLKYSLKRGRMQFGAALFSAVVMLAAGCNSDFSRPQFLQAFRKKPTHLTEEFVSSSAPTQNIGLWHDSFESAQEESIQTGKPILASFTGSDWCHWCVKLEEDVLETGEFQRWASEQVVLLKLDYPKRTQQATELKKQNQKLAKRYSISSYPTVLLLESDGSVLGRLGYMKSPAAWISMANNQLGNSQNQRVATQQQNGLFR